MFTRVQSTSKMSYDDTTNLLNSLSKDNLVEVITFISSKVDGFSSILKDAIEEITNIDSKTVVVQPPLLSLTNESSTNIKKDKKPKEFDMSKYEFTACVRIE